MGLRAIATVVSTGLLAVAASCATATNGGGGPDGGGPDATSTRASSSGPSSTGSDATAATPSTGASASTTSGGSIMVGTGPTISTTATSASSSVATSSSSATSGSVATSATPSTGITTTSTSGSGRGDGGLDARCTSGDQCTSGACAGGYCQEASACTSDSQCGVGPNGQNVCLNVHSDTPTVGVCHPSCFTTGEQSNCPTGWECCNGVDANRTGVNACAVCGDD